MKKIKKMVSFILLASMCSLLFGQMVTFARNESLNFGVYNLSGKREYVVNAVLDELMIKDENGGSGIERSKIDTNMTISEKITSVVETGENFVYMDMKTDNSENPYPEIETTTVTIMTPQATGNIPQLIGKDYRLYFAENEDAELEDISDKIADISESRPQFTLEKLGIYILCFNPKVYNITFYLEEPIYEEGVWINQDCVYKKIEGLEYKDTIEFPDIPQKDGYIFTGWKAQHFAGGGYENPFKYTMPQPIKVSAHRDFFATWCLEDEYEPINIELSSSEPITKGKENGKKITIKTNYGVFVNGDEFPTDWRTVYDSETDEQTKADILSEWKSKWNIIGSNEIIVESATRIDDKTVELVLSGNSSDKYTTSNIQIEFDSSLLLSEPIGEGDELIYPPDSKIKIDEAGVRAKMYRSDNAVTLSKQSRPSKNGSGGTTTYTVKFDTIGGNTISGKTVTRNSKVAEPTAPAKDGYSFTGWFTDEELTEAYDFDKAVTKSFTLYAKWEKHDDDTDDKTDEKTDTPVWENPFTDVESDDWYYADVEYAVENGLFNGTTSSTFVPDGIITRGMMVAVLYRAESEPEITGTTTFDDVDRKAYYANAVVWAQQNGIVNGISENEFAPDKNIAREQIAAIMFRYAQYKGVAPTGAWAIRLDYADLAEISDYAVEGVMYCKLAEIMQGKGNNSFAPKDNATRAETAAILHRFIETNK